MARHASTRTDAVEAEIRRLLEYADGAAYNASCTNRNTKLFEETAADAIQHLQTARCLVESRDISLQIAFVEAAVRVFDSLGNPMASGYLSATVLPALETARRTRTPVKISWNL